jgi:hypothetical protein
MTHETDRLLPLMMSLNSTPGAYVCLLGAGLSTAAQIPEAWQIMETLITQIATVAGDERPTDPQAWYQQRYSKEPTYAGVLDQLGTAPDDRSGLLAPFFDRTDSDDPDAKRPTIAHRALATLAKRGYIKVFVTTNFDDLLEQALKAEGINTLVVSREADAEAVVTFDLHNAVVIHAHGERTHAETLRNTVTELDAYHPWLQEVLDRVLQGRGLVIVGWSGNHDPALREMVRGSRADHFATYWLDLRAPAAGTAASSLLTDVSAHYVECDAQSALPTILDGMAVLERRAGSVGVLSVPAIAVARMKNEITTTSQPIHSLDTLAAALEDLVQLPERAVPIPAIQVPSASERRRVILYHCRTPCALAMTLGFWAIDDSVMDVLDLVAAAGHRPVDVYGVTSDLEVSRLPGLLVLTAMALGAMSRRRVELAARILTGARVVVPNETHEVPLSVAAPLSEMTGTDRGLGVIAAYHAAVASDAHVLTASQAASAWDQLELLWHVVSHRVSQYSLDCVPHQLVQGRSGQYRPVNYSWLQDKVGTGLDIPAYFPKMDSRDALAAAGEAVGQYAQNAAGFFQPTGAPAVFPSGQWRPDEFGVPDAAPQRHTAWDAIGRGLPAPGLYP